jgi:hypothetical protein
LLGEKLGKTGGTEIFRIGDPVIVEQP